MHSHARTMLSRFGFADVDRKSPRHDLACNYLALRPDVLKRTLKAALPASIHIENASAELEFPITKGEGQYSTTVGWVDVLTHFRAQLRFKLSAPVRDFEMSKAEALAALKAGETHDTHVSLLGVGIIEVKIGRVGAGDLIRQMRLYNQHGPSLSRSRRHGRIHTDAPGWMSPEGSYMQLGGLSGEYWEHKTRRAFEHLDKCMEKLTIACCDYDMDAEYTKALRASGIQPVRLGEGFENFIREQATSEDTEEIVAI